MYTFSFTTEEEKEAILSEQLQKGLVLQEINYLFTGNTIVFKDKTIEDSIEERVRDLEQVTNNLLLTGGIYNV